MFRNAFQLAGFLVRPARLQPSASKMLPRNPRSISSSTRKAAYVRFSTPGGPPKKPPNDLRYRNWDPRMKGAVVILGLGGVYYVSNLEQVPETGRWRFMNTSPSYEAKFAELTRKQMRAEFGSNTLPPNHPVSRHVRRVVSRILHASNLGVLHGETPLVSSPFGLGHDSEGHAWNPDAEFGAAADPGATYGPSKEWDVIVVNDVKTMNAMALPGIIVVFTGILPVCQDEEGLAAVLAHEIGHVVARHSAERLSAQTVAWILLVGLAVFGIDMGMTDFFQRLFMELPNSRTQEHEADLIGLRLMSRACYNPEASPEMFSRLGKLESMMGSKGMSFFQTHPSSESRVKQLESYLPEAFSILSANPDCENVRQQLESFKETAHAIKFDHRHNDFEIS